MSAITFNCEFCSKSFSTKYNLKIHQSKTKNCLSIQEKKIQFNYIEKIKELEKQLDEKDKIIENLKVENHKISAELKNERTNKEELQKMLMKCNRQYNNTNSNNNNITNNITIKQIQYSMKTLHPYEELKQNLENIVNSKFNRRTFLSLSSFYNFITNDILNYNNKTFCQCYDSNGSIFHKKENDKITFDEKAEQLLNDIYPYIEKRARKIYMDIIDDNLDKTDSESERIIFNSKNCLATIINIGKSKSEERLKCLKKIIKSYQIYPNQIKNDANNEYTDIILID